VVEKLLPQLQSHAIELAHEWVSVLAALHHAIDKVEEPSLDGIGDHTNHHRISFLLCFVS